MPKARPVYVLTQDGQIQGATYSRDRAERWLGLGSMYDYVPVTPEDVGGEGDAPESVKEQPSKAMQRSQDIIQRQKEVQQRLDKRLKKLESPLLQPEQA